MFTSSFLYAVINVPITSKKGIFMKKLLVLILLAVPFWAFASEKQSFMPENDLWKEDNAVLAANGMTEDLFNRIIDIGEEMYSPIAKQWGETLYINRMYGDSTVNASAWRDGKGLTEIRMYGGLARRQEVVPLSFALVLCHELGHLYGMSPYIEPRLFVSAEGQADYNGAGECLYQIAKKLEDDTRFEVTPYMDQVCREDKICLKRMGGANGLGKLLSRLSGDVVPRFETPDLSVVRKTELSYPRTTQCRLDTYHNAILGLTRPRCWYAGG